MFCLYQFCYLYKYQILINKIFKQLNYSAKNNLVINLIIIILLNKPQIVFLIFKCFLNVYFQKHKIIKNYL